MSTEIDKKIALCERKLQEIADTMQITGKMKKDSKRTKIFRDLYRLRKFWSERLVDYELDKQSIK